MTEKQRLCERVVELLSLVESSAQSILAKESQFVHFRSSRKYKLRKWIIFNF